MSLLGIPAWVMSPQYGADMQSRLELISGRVAKGNPRCTFRSRAAKSIPL